MKKIFLYGLVLMLFTSISYAQTGVTTNEIEGVMQSISMLMGEMDGLIKKVTPKKMQDMAENMKQTSENMKDMLKKMDKGTAIGRNMRADYENMKDMSKKMRGEKVKVKEMKAIKDEMKAMKDRMMTMKGKKESP